MKLKLLSLFMIATVLFVACKKKEEPKEPVDDLELVIPGTWILQSMSYSGKARIPALGDQLQNVRGDGKDITGEMIFKQDPNVVESNTTFKVTVELVVPGNAPVLIPGLEADFFDLFNGGEYEVLSNRKIALQEDTLFTEVNVTSYTNSSINLEFDAKHTTIVDGDTLTADITIKSFFKKSL